MNFACSEDEKLLNIFLEFVDVDEISVFSSDWLSSTPFSLRSVWDWFARLMGGVCSIGLKLVGVYSFPVLLCIVGGLQKVRRLRWSKSCRNVVSSGWSNRIEFKDSITCWSVSCVLLFTSLKNCSSSTMSPNTKSSML